MLCRDASLIKHTAAFREIIPLPCRCWHCERCAPDRVKKLKRQARAGNPTRFLTLTVAPKEGETPQQRAVALKWAFTNLRRRMLVKLKVTHIPFLAVFEKTKNGEPHLHVMLRCKFIHQRWISAQMADMIGAPVVDIRHVTDKGRVAAYVAKYIAKAPERWEGCKRYWSSQDWEVPVPEKPGRMQWAPLHWEVSKSNPNVLWRLALWAGSTVLFMERSWIVHDMGVGWDPFRKKGPVP